MNDKLKFLVRNAHIMGVVVMTGLIAGMAVNYAAQQKKDAHEKQQYERMLDTNIGTASAQIKNVRYKIDSLRQATESNIADSLARHPEYKFIVEHQAEYDSLKSANSELMDQAYAAAHKKTILGVVRRNESLFREYASIPTVRYASWKYFANKKKIQDFEKRYNQVKDTPQIVRAFFENQSNAEIFNLQLKMDSLLNHKDSLITQKTR